MPGLLSSLQRLQVQRNNTAAYNELVTVHIPVAPADPDDYDPITGDMKDITQTPPQATWQTSPIYCRIAHTGNIPSTTLTFKSLVEIYDPGDVFLSTLLVHSDLLGRARDTKGAYLTVEDAIYRVASVNANQVEGQSSLLVLCKPTTTG